MSQTCMYTLCTVPIDSSLHTCYVQIWKITGMPVTCTYMYRDRGPTRWHTSWFLQMYHDVHVCTWYVQGMYKARYKHGCTLFRHVCTRLYVYVLIMAFWIIWTCHGMYNVQTWTCILSVASGSLRYYDIIVLLWYHSFDFDIMINIMSMIS